MAKAATDNAAYFPELLAMKSMSILRKYMVMANLVSVDFKNQLGKQGKTTTTRVRAPFTAHTKTIGGSVSVQDAKAREVPVNLDQHEEVTFLIEDIEEGWSFKGLIKEYIEPAMYALADKVDQALINAVYTATPNVSNIATAESGTTFDVTDMLTARKWLNGQHALFEDRVGVLGVETEAQALLNAKDYLGRNQIGEEGTRLKDASIGKIFGTNWFLSSNIGTETSGSPDHEKNLIFHKHAVQMVNRTLPIPPAGMGALGQVVNDGNVALRVIQSYNADRLGVQVTIDLLFGVKVMNWNYSVAPPTYLVGIYPQATQ